MNTIKQQLYELENRHLQPEVRQSAEALGDLMADDFIEYGQSGRIFNKQQELEGIPSSSSYRLVLKDFEVDLLAPGVALTRYRIERHESETEIRHSLRSTVWKQIDGKWKMVFHQGTPTNPEKGD